MAVKQEGFNSEQIAEFLKEAVQKVKTEEDPVVLNQLKKVFKQNVPFTLRMYVAAYLTRQFTSGAKRSGRQESKNDRLKKHSEDTTPKAPRIVIDESAASTIFISVGRNRRVFPRDLITLLVTVAQIERERIGEIRVLDNYSFIQVFSEDAENIIELLNGYDFRGRKLSVSYSRKRDDTTDFVDSADDIDGTELENPEDDPLI